MKYLVLSVLITFVLNSCMNTKGNVKYPREIKIDSTSSDYQQRNSPDLIVYRTKSNYNNLIPVTLSEDKSHIVSYPHPSDVIGDGNYTLPIQLNGGYLIDYRGINRNTAFLNITYKDYANLNRVPSTIDLYKIIIDKNPFLELCNCGNRYLFTNIEDELNQLILNDSLFIKCKSLK